MLCFFAVEFGEKGESQIKEALTCALSREGEIVVNTAALELIKITKSILTASDRKTYANTICKAFTSQLDDIEDNYR